LIHNSFLKCIHAFLFYVWLSLIKLESKIDLPFVKLFFLEDKNRQCLNYLDYPDCLRIHVNQENRKVEIDATTLENNQMPLQRPQNKFLACFLTRRCPYNAFAICIKRRYYFDRYAYKHIYMLKWQHRYLESALVRSSTCAGSSYWYLRECSSTVPASLGISI